jgi:hypothetical protein
MTTLHQLKDQQTTESTFMKPAFRSTDDKGPPYKDDLEKVHPTLGTDFSKPVESTQDSIDEESKEELYGWIIVFVAFLVQICIAGVTSCW